MTLSVQTQGASQDQSTVSAFLSALQEELRGEDIDTHLEGCIGCGACGYACNWFLASNQQDRHPKTRADSLRRICWRDLTPLGKLLQRIGLVGPTTIEDLQQLTESMYYCCTMCGRCTLACPQGVSNRRLVELTRNALARAGIMPPTVQTIRDNAQNMGHSYGLTYEESLGRAVQIAADHGTTIPVDRKGAEFLLGCSAILNSRFPEGVADGVGLLLAAGINCTLSSKVIDTGTEAMTTVVDLKLGRMLAERVVKEAVNLGCKGVVIGECGCDMRTFFVEAGDIFRRYGIRPLYVDNLLLDAIKAGRLPLSRLDMRATYHDPCWTARLTGFYDPPRELLSHCVRTVVEMTPNREYNYCCNGGAGMMRIYPPDYPAPNPRRVASKLKAAQLRNTNAQIVATPCTTCWLALDDTITTYAVPMEAATVVQLVRRSWKAAIEGVM